MVSLVADDRGRPIRLSYQVVEQQPPGTFVANVALDAGIAARLPADSLRHIRFRFLSEGQRLLSISALSGVITTADVIDRDRSSLCRQRESCQLNVDVVIQPVEFFQVSPSFLQRRSTYTQIFHAPAVVKVKFSHTRYRALSPELIPVHRQSARR